MKVKIFANETVSALEDRINAFLQDDSNDVSCIFDIKFSTSDHYSEAMIIYREKLKEAN